jgi:hypothetical protein
MSVNGKSIKKFSAAMDAMRKPDTRLLQTNCDALTIGLKVRASVFHIEIYLWKLESRER